MPLTSRGPASQSSPKTHFPQRFNRRLAQGQKQVETVCTRIVLREWGGNRKGISILGGQ